MRLPRSIPHLGLPWVLLALERVHVLVPTLSIGLEDELVDAENLDVAALAPAVDLSRQRCFHLYPSNTEERGGGFYETF